VLPDTPGVTAEGSEVSATTETAQGTEGAVTNQPTDTQPDQFSQLRSTYDARLSASQRALQEAMRRIEEMDNQLFEVQIGNLPPEEQTAAKTTRGVEAKTKEIAQKEQIFEHIAKVVMVQNLTHQYGVPVEELVQFNDPVAMELYAKKVFDLRKGQKLDKRKEEKTDTVETGGGSTAAYDPAKFRNSGDLVGAMKAKRAAGLSR